MLSVVMSITKLNKITRITFKCQQTVVTTKPLKITLVMVLSNLFQVHSVQLEFPGGNFIKLFTAVICEFA
jgi:hypothetical protein